MSDYKQAWQRRLFHSLTENDFHTGSLPVLSNIRPKRIFTSDKTIIIRKAASIKPEVKKQVLKALAEILGIE